MRLAAAAQLPKSPARPRQATSTPSHKRLRSPSSDDDINPTSRRRHASPLTDDEPQVPAPPRPMNRPMIGSVLTFKKGGKAFVQDKNRQVQDYRAFRRRGGIYWQQHQRKERERRLAEAKKRAEEAAEAAAEEARRVTEALHEAQEAERIADEERMAEEAARIVEEANERACRAAEWSAPRPEPPRKPSPPPLKELLANSLDDDLPDFEDDEAEPMAEAQPIALPIPSIFGSSNSLLSGDTKPTKKKTDPYFWAKKLDEERKHKELMSRHPRFKLLTQQHGALIDVFIKDITNEPPRPPNAPTVAILADTIIDGITMQDEVESAIVGVERGWNPARSVARLAPVDHVHWAALEVLALELLVEGKVIIGDQNADGWRPIIFASEEEGIFKMLGASDKLANFKSTLLMTMVKSTS
ncbi:hypothetical protein FRC08_003353 [Ceratobasidium sp. 394]|nr:hypothetical protein FRC08_003353 [Ceratobasidium sp. 394]